MSEPFVGEIRMFGFNFPPRGWALCNGQSMGISQNSALFSLLGTMYGGDGTTSFNLPDLRSRVAVGFGQGPGLTNYVQGQVAGAENVTLTVQQLASHTHTLNGDTGAGTTNVPTGNRLAAGTTGGKGSSTPVSTYSAGTPTGPTALNASSIGVNGNSQPHTNVQPQLAMNYCIALVGVFPARN